LRRWTEGRERDAEGLDAGCQKPAKPLREDLKVWLLACRG
jgi:hypothetical protein